MGMIGESAQRADAQGQSTTEGVATGEEGFTWDPGEQPDEPIALRPDPAGELAQIWAALDEPARVALVHVAQQWGSLSPFQRLQIEGVVRGCSEARARLQREEL